MAQTEIQNSAHIYNGRQIPSEDWNRELDVMHGDEIYHHLHPFYLAPLPLKPHNSTLCSKYLEIAQSHCHFPPSIILSSFKDTLAPHDGKEKKLIFFDIIRDAYGRTLIPSLGQKRIACIIRMLRESFGNSLKHQLAGLCRDCPIKGIENDLFCNLRICIYYYIGFLVLNDRETASIFHAFTDMFLSGNLPFFKTQDNSLVVIVQ